MEDESEGHLSLSLNYELLAQGTLKDRGFIWIVFKIFFTADTGHCELKMSSWISYPMSFFYKGMLIQCHERRKGKSPSQSCLTLCDPKDCSLPGSSIHGVFQARVLEWVAISFSRRSSLPGDWTWVSQIAGRRFTIWATREAECHKDIFLYLFSLEALLFHLSHLDLWLT